MAYYARQEIVEYVLRETGRGGTASVPFTDLAASALAGLRGLGRLDKGAFLQIGCEEARRIAAEHGLTLRPGSEAGEFRNDSWQRERRAWRRAFLEGRASLDGGDSGGGDDWPRPRPGELFSDGERFHERYLALPSDPGHNTFACASAGGSAR